MVFKPFKPPLIRKTPQPSTEPTEDRDYSAKKPRLHNEDASDAISQGPKLPLGTRKPLAQVKNIGKEAAAETAPETTSNDVHDERYFDALW